MKTSVKEFYKSVSVWWSYGQKSSVLFFDSVYLHTIVPANIQPKQPT